MPTALLLIELYLVVIALDVLLAWVQPDPRRWPRRLTHVLTEPPQRLIRRALPPERTGGWELSALVMMGLLGALRVWMVRWR